MDIEAIRYQRRIDSTFREEQNGYTQSTVKVDVKFFETKNYSFEKGINTSPFLPKTDMVENYRIANEIQVQGLIQKIKTLKRR